MAIGRGRPDAGKGGGLGRSNMAYWGTNAEAKEDGRKRRRKADRGAVQEGLADATSPERRVKYRKRRSAS